MCQPFYMEVVARREKNIGTQCLSFLQYICIDVLTTIGLIITVFEPRHEKTCFRGFRPGKTQTGLRSHIS